MKTTTAFLLGTAALVASAGPASATRPQHPSLTTTGAPHYAHRIVRSSRLATLYDQNSDDNGIAIISQNFESSLDAYDSQAADDFTVPVGGGKWRVNEVDVTGVYFNGYGPAVSENVFFYKDSKGLPGKLVHEFDNLSGKDDGTGSFAITLPGIGQKLMPGVHYWVSVQINMDFQVGGEWGWEESSVVHGEPSAWQNPGGGFGICPKWNYAYLCIPNAPQASGGYDQMFALKGKTKGG